MLFNAKLGLAACLAVTLVGALYAFQVPPFREYPGVEYELGEIPLPPDYQEQTEWTFARLMYPQAAGGRYGRLGGRGGRGGGGVWTEGNSIWTQDYPRADRHFSEALRRLTRIQGRSVEQPINLNDGNVYEWPWLYAVQAGHWQLTDPQIRTLREYLLRGGFFMADDFWGPNEWDVFMATMRKVLPGRDPVELGNDDPIFHVVYDLGERYQVASEGSAQRGVSYKCADCPARWLGIRDDKGRIMVAITFQSDIGDSWEWADAPYYPEVYSRLGIRIGLNYIVYDMTH
jgi:uncharacterized protein DUF4159